MLTLAGIYDVVVGPRGAAWGLAIMFVAYLGLVRSYRKEISELRTSERVEQARQALLEPWIATLKQKVERGVTNQRDVDTTAGDVFSLVLKEIFPPLDAERRCDEIDAARSGKAPIDQLTVLRDAIIEIDKNLTDDQIAKSYGKPKAGRGGRGA